MHQPGAGAEDEPVGQVRALALLTQGDPSRSQRGTEEMTAPLGMFERIPPPGSLCLDGGFGRGLEMS